MLRHNIKVSRVVKQLIYLRQTCNCTRKLFQSLVAVFKAIYIVLYTLFIDDLYITGQATTLHLRKLHSMQRTPSIQLLLRHLIHVVKLSQAINTSKAKVRNRLTFLTQIWRHLLISFSLGTFLSARLQLKTFHGGNSRYRRLVRFLAFDLSRPLYLVPL